MGSPLDICITHGSTLIACHECVMETIAREQRVMKARLGARLREKVADFDEVFDQVMEEMSR